MRPSPMFLVLLTACMVAAPDLDGGPRADAPAPDVPPPPNAAAWPEGDALFHREPRWLGGDAAYSVDLGDERVLWLFGDSFVATSEALVRSESRLVRNSVAVQTGLCPTSAAITFHWREEGAMPSSWLPEDGENWRWPLHGVVADGTLTLFWLREAPSSGGLGFESVGWEAFRVSDFSEDPSTWALEPLEGFETPFPAAVGATVIAEGDHVYAYVVEEPGTHSVYLLRWDRAAFVAGNLTAPAWWNGDAWLPHASLTERPLSLFVAATELSVDRTGPARFTAVYTQGFGATTIGVNDASAIEGPFGGPRTVLRPPESDRDDVFVYAAKGHGELSCPETGGQPAHHLRRQRHRLRHAARRFDALLPALRAAADRRMGMSHGAAGWRPGAGDDRSDSGGMRGIVGGDAPHAARPDAIRREHGAGLHDLGPGRGAPAGRGGSRARRRL